MHPHISQHSHTSWVTTVVYSSPMDVCNNKVKRGLIIWVLTRQQKCIENPNVKIKQTPGSCENNHDELFGGHSNLKCLNQNHMI